MYKEHVVVMYQGYTSEPAAAGQGWKSGRFYADVSACSTTFYAHLSTTRSLRYRYLPTIQFSVVGLSLFFTDPIFQEILDPITDLT